MPVTSARPCAGWTALSPILSSGAGGRGGAGGKNDVGGEAGRRDEGGPPDGGFARFDPPAAATDGGAAGGRADGGVGVEGLEGVRAKAFGRAMGGDKGADG